MKVLVVADELYSGDEFKQVLLDAVSEDPKRHHRLITNIRNHLS
jgi:hypothetical protein